MNLQHLTDKFQTNPRLFQLADRLTYASPQRLYLKNLNGSSTEFIISAIFNNKITESLNHLIILNDAEEAAYFHNTLESLTGALDLFYFPSSFKNRKNFKLLNSSHVMLRAEALMRLSNGGNKKLIVTHPEALFEKVVLPKTLSGNIIQLKTNDNINLNGLMELFVMYGFERTDFVYEPGQFALRGGILDIYSYGNEKPYRIELFGNDVDSIRIFDPETQLSERKLMQVSIIPNVETQFDSGEKVSLLEFLPENTVVWIQDWQFAKERIEVQEEDLDFFLELRKENTGKSDHVEEDDDTKVLKEVNPIDFIKAEVIEKQLAARHIIEFDRGNYFNGFEIEFNTKEQPAFNRQFDLLIKDLKQWESKGFELFIFAENPKQLERLHIIFEDLKAEITFTPLANDIHRGFIDEDVKVVCYTDHQVFQRYHKYKVKQAYNKNKALTLRTLRELQPGDYVTHIDHGVGTYSGLQKIEANGRLQEAVRIIYKDNDILYVNINSLIKSVSIPVKKEVYRRSIRLVAMHGKN
jgi:transcription-repair coupling factor (superfamily II helicase)